MQPPPGLMPREEGGAAGLDEGMWKGGAGNLVLQALAAKKSVDDLISMETKKSGREEVQESQGEVRSYFLPTAQTKPRASAPAPTCSRLTPDLSANLTDSTSKMSQNPTNSYHVCGCCPEHPGACP